MAPARYNDPSRAATPVLALEGRLVRTTSEGLQALVEAVATTEVVWFSGRPSPSHGEQRIIACGDPGLCPDVTVGVPIHGAVTRLLGHQAREHTLTAQVAAHFAEVDEEGVWDIRLDRHCASLTPSSEPVLRRLLQAMLRRAGVSAEVATRSDAAVGALRKLLRAYPAVRLAQARRHAGVLSVTVEVPSERRGVDDRLRPAVLAASFEPIGELELEGATAHATLRPVSPRRPAR